MNKILNEGKLKGMFDNMGKVSDSMIVCFKEKSNQVFFIEIIKILSSYILWILSF